MKYGEFQKMREGQKVSLATLRMYKFMMYSKVVLAALAYGLLEALAKVGEGVLLGIGAVGGVAMLFRLLGVT